MGRKGKRKGLKRKPSPRYWPLHRKEFTWAVRPASGPHSFEECMPLAIVLRDLLDVAKTRKEAKKIVAAGKVYVDGKIRRRDDFSVGLMDVISIPEIGGHYCVLPSHKGLFLSPVKESESKFKLSRIEDKTVAENGNAQLHLHDGSNIIIKTSDQKEPVKDVYKTLDTLKISLPQKEVLGHIAMKEQDYVMITGGKNAGKFGRMVEIEKAEGKKRRSELVTVEDNSGNKYQTTLEFVFALGEEQSLIALPEAT